MASRWSIRIAAATAVIMGTTVMAVGQGVDVRIVLPEEPATLDPCFTAANVNGRVGLSNVFEALTARDPINGQIMPALATGMEEVSDTTWRFTLREGVTFHDGSPVNGEAVKYSIERMLNPNLSCETRTKFFAASGVTVEVVDDLTIDITSEVRDPILPLKMSTVSIHPLSVSFDSPVRQAEGTGPYSIEEWAAGQHIRLQRNADYWGEAPGIDSAEFIWRSESSVRAAMVQQGEADLAPSIAVQDVTADLGTSYPNAETTRLNLDQLTPPLDDLRVRQAINLAIDRQAMLGTVVSAESILATQLIVPQINGYNHDLELWAYDQERARALIVEAAADGVPVDAEIEFVGRIGHFPNATEFHEVIAIMLQEVGLNVRLQWYEAAEKNRLQVKPFDENRRPQIIVDQHDNTSGDPVFTLPSRWHSEGAQSKTANAELDAMMDAATSATGEARTLAWQQVAAKIDELVPDAMLFHMVGYAAIGDRIEYVPSLVTNSEVRLSDINLK